MTNQRITIMLDQGFTYITKKKRTLTHTDGLVCVRVNHDKTASVLCEL